MRVIEMPSVKVFHFNELDEAAQKVAIEKMRDTELDYDWSEGIVDLFKGILTSLGFADDVTTPFSGFWCQGDGASFFGEYRHAKGAKKVIAKLISHMKEETQKSILEAVDGIIALQKKHAYRIGAKVYSSTYHYCHEYTMSIETLKDVLDPDENHLSHDEDQELLEYFRVLARIYYRELQSSYYYLTSEEAAKEHIESDIDNYEFYEDGQPYS